MTELDGAHVLVTGAASGLGRSLAIALAKRGATLSLWDRDRDGLADVATGIGPQASTVACDISDRTAVYAAAKQVGRPVDVLINNAGVVSGRSFLDLSDEQIEKSLEVNTHALFWMLKAFLPAMLERDRGHVVTIASAAGLIGVPQLSDYCASKFAAVGLDESLRVELKKRGSRVRTTVVCPYYIDTGMFQGVKTRFSWLLPILREERVVRKILWAIERDQSRLYLPPLVYSIPLLRLLPVSWFDLIARVMGISASMDDFKGRKGRSP